MSKRKPQRSETRSKGPSTPPSRDVIKIFYAPDETGPAEMLGERLARIVDVPILTDAFWRDDIVRLKEQEGEGYPTIAEVVFTRHEQRTRLKFFGGQYVGVLLMNLFSLLQTDCAVIVLPKEEGPGILSVAHPAGLKPAAVLKLIGADKG